MGRRLARDCDAGRASRDESETTAANQRRVGTPSGGTVATTMITTMAASTMKSTAAAAISKIVGRIDIRIRTSHAGAGAAPERPGVS